MQDKESIYTHLYYMYRHGSEIIESDRKEEFEELLKEEGLDFSCSLQHQEEGRSYYFYENDSDPISRDKLNEKVRGWR